MPDRRLLLLYDHEPNGVRVASFALSARMSRRIYFLEVLAPSELRRPRPFGPAVSSARGSNLTIDHILLRVVPSQWNGAVAIPLAMSRVRDSHGAILANLGFRCA